MTDWPEVQFASLLSEPLRNGLYKPKEFHGRGAKVINMGELFAFPRMRSVPMKRVDVDPKEATRFAIKEGDLIFARRSLVAEGAGKCTVILDVEELTVFESSIIRARPAPEKAYSLFYYYLFNSPIGMHKLDTIRRQVAVAGITGGDLAELSLPVPPLPEQRAIAATLGALDDKIELNRRMNATLESMARALFRDWFVDFGPTRAKAAGLAPYLSPDLWSLFPDRLDADGKPEGWEAGTLGDVATLNPESWSAKRAPALVRYVDLANTKWGSIDKIEEYDWADAPSRARRILRPGDTIVGTVRPGNGSFTHVGEDGLTGSTGFAVMRPNNPRDRGFVWCAATSPENIERLAHLADGGAYPAVRPDAVAATETVIPDGPILGAFDKIASAHLDMIEASKRESRTLARTRDLLLPRLMSGELRLAEAEQIASEVA